MGVSPEIPIAVAANVIARVRADRHAPHNAPAATMDGPMMLRISTFSRLRGFPHPRIHAWRRKTKARKNIQAPRFMTAAAAACPSPLRRHFELAERTTD